MNFLAHLYLSENNKNIMIGNFITDHIRGNKFDHYTTEIQKGIRLHREIDSFTDAHKTVRISKRRLHERYGHYDGVIIDIFYDYFLAKNWSTYSDISLKEYTKEVYSLLSENIEILPKQTQSLLPNMIKYDWLYNYQFISGIQQVLDGVNKITKGISKMNLAISDLQEFENELENDFTIFFEDLRNFTHKKINNLDLL